MIVKVLTVTIYSEEGPITEVCGVFTSDDLLERQEKLAKKNLKEEGYTNPNFKVTTLEIDELYYT